MAFKLADNVLETSTTSGTGTLTLLGAETGYQAFGARMSNSDTCFYVLWNDTKYEVGLGTFLTGADRLQRDTVYDSSTTPTPGEKEDFGGGTINVGIALPGAVVESLLDPSAGAGVLALQTDGSYSQHSFGDGTHITWSNPDGDGGAPTLVDSLLDTRFARIDEVTTFGFAVQFNNDTFHDAAIFLDNQTAVNGQQTGLSYTNLITMTGADVVQVGSWSSDTEIRVDATDGLTVNEDAGSPGPKKIWHAGNLDAFGSTLTEFNSAARTYAPGDDGSIAHSLTARPRSVFATLVCIATDGGYAAGDAIHLASHLGIEISSGWGFSVGASATHVFYAVAANGLNLVNKTGTGTFIPTVAKWELYIHAWL